MRDIYRMGERAGALLKARGEKIAVGETSAGGLISASQAYFLWPPADRAPSFLYDLTWQLPPWLFGVPALQTLTLAFSKFNDSTISHPGPPAWAATLRRVDLSGNRGITAAPAWRCAWACA